MKREEKTKRTCERILDAALLEFGTKSYETASLNAICENNGISKGLLYHNFKSRDELYLQCVAMCYDEFVKYLRSDDFESDDIQKTLSRILERRQEFFESYPLYANIFFDTLLRPPKQLVDRINELKSEFDEFNRNRYKELLGKIRLRDGISQEDALEYINVFQRMYNEYFRYRSNTGESLRELATAHESRLYELLDILLYGIAEKEQKGEQI